MDESLGFRLFRAFTDCLRGVLLLEELMRVVLDLTLTGARPLGYSCWGETRFSTLHCKINLSSVGVLCYSWSRVAEFYR